MESLGREARVRRRLIFRCSKCRGVTKAAVDLSATRAAFVACSACGERFALDPELNRGDSNHEYYEAARECASANRIDLPSAYSVLEGILTLDKVRTLPERSRTAPQSTRQVWHLVVLGMGFVVLAALAGLLRDDVSAPGSVTRTPPVLRTESPEPEAVSPAPKEREAYASDPSGRLLAVSGPDPENALEAFCRHPQYEKLAPIGIAPGVPAAPGSRIGILRDPSDLSHPRAVRMHLDMRTHRWVIGDGYTPIAIEQIRDLPPETRFTRR